MVLKFEFDSINSIYSVHILQTIFVQCTVFNMSSAILSREINSSIIIGLTAVQMSPNKYSQQF